MDRRLKLTAKQKELVKEVEKAFAALEKEHVGIIFDVDSREFRLYNSAEILDYDKSEEYSQLEDEYYEEPYGDYLTETEDGCLWYSPKLFDLESLSANIMMTDYESWFAVELKENEDSDVFRHLDGIAQAKSNIGIFREKGLAQDLIDEENASILSNQEAADNIQQVIGELESEIDQLRKV